jgi:hypothetical protein
MVPVLKNHIIGFLMQLYASKYIRFLYIITFLDEKTDSTLNIGHLHFGQLYKSMVSTDEWHYKCLTFAAQSRYYRLNDHPCESLEYMLYQTQVSPMNIITHDVLLLCKGRCIDNVVSKTHNLQSILYKY